MGSVCTSNKNKRKEENSQVNNEARNQNPTNNRENVIVENPRQTNVQNNVNYQIIQTKMKLISIMRLTIIE